MPCGRASADGANTLSICPEVRQGLGCVGRKQVLARGMLSESAEIRNTLQEKRNAIC
jgi:hypothetical protein